MTYIPSSVIHRGGNKPTDIPINLRGTFTTPVIFQPFHNQPLFSSEEVHVERRVSSRNFSQNCRESSVSYDISDERKFQTACAVELASQRGTRRRFAGPRVPLSTGQRIRLAGQRGVVIVVELLNESARLKIPRASIGKRFNRPPLEETRDRLK